MTLLQQLLSRGDSISIQNGKLSIIPASGKAIPKGWLDKNEQGLIHDCLKQAKKSAYRYVGYSVGNYGGGKYSGIALQFIDVITGKSVYACFNAITKRQRTSKQGKQGSSLPKGQFRVNKKSSFVRFWNATGLPIPPRYYDRMGQLSKVLFKADISQGDKLINKSIKPITISHENLKRATKERPSSDQETTKARPKTATKENATTQAINGLEHDSNYGNDLLRLTLTRKDGYKGNDISPTTYPINQTNEEWLDEYIHSKPLGLKR